MSIPEYPTRLMRTVASLMLLAWATSVASAFSLQAQQDAYIRRNFPDLNDGSSPQVCVTGNQENLYLLSWDFSEYADWSATSDAVFSLRGIWAQGDDVLAGLYELTNGPFDEDTVTYANYVGDSDQGPLGALGALCDTSCDASWEVQFSVPQATMTRLLKGQVDGLAIGSAPGVPVNCCYGTLDSHSTQPKPRLTFEARVDGSDMLPGDANGDGTVTDADYTIWADHYGHANATWETGDFNGDDLVTDADFTIWADYYGQVARPVPDPSPLIQALGMVSVAHASASLRLRWRN
jgi:hypothetical protein